MLTGLKNFVVRLLTALLEAIDGKTIVKEDLLDSLKMGKEELIKSMNVVLGQNGIFLADLLEVAASKAKVDGEAAVELGEKAKFIRLDAEADFQKIVKVAAEDRGRKIAEATKISEEADETRKRKTAIENAVSLLQF